MLNWSRRAKMRARPACGWSLAFSKSIRAVLTSLRPMPSICAPRRCDCWIATANTWCRFSRTTDRIFCAMRNRSLHATSQPWNNRLTFGWKRWDMEGFQTDWYEKPLRVIRSREIRQQRRRIGAQWVREQTTHDWWWATDVAEAFGTDGNCRRPVW